jgi:hypothetical protein
MNIKVIDIVARFPVDENLRLLTKDGYFIHDDIPYNLSLEYLKLEVERLYTDLDGVLLLEVDYERGN